MGPDHHDILDNDADKHVKQQDFADKEENDEKY